MTRAPRKNPGACYTLRRVPRRVDAALRAAAKQQGKSLNSVAIEALARGLGLRSEEIRYHDLDDLVGSWVEDPAFDEAIEAMDQIDAELWT